MKKNNIKMSAWQTRTYQRWVQILEWDNELQTKKNKTKTKQKKQKQKQANKQKNHICTCI